LQPGGQAFLFISRGFLSSRPCFIVFLCYSYRIVGRRSGRSFTFGDRVQVTVRQTNLLKRSIDLDLVGMQRERKQKKHPFQSPRKKPNNRVVPKGKKRQSKIGRKRKP